MRNYFQKLRFGSILFTFGPYSFVLDFESDASTVPPRKFGWMSDEAVKQAAGEYAVFGKLFLQKKRLARLTKRADTTKRRIENERLLL